MRQPIIALDLGTQNTRALAVVFDKKHQVPRILDYVSSKTSGLRKGVVVDLEEASMTVANLLSQLQRKINQPFKKIYVNISGEGINVKPSRGATAVARADNEITQDDVNRAVESSRTIGFPMNRTLLHTIPVEFYVDGVGPIQDPIGMNGIRLEVESLLIDCFSPILKNLIKAVEGLSGYQVEEVVYNPLLSLNSVLSKNQKELGVLLLDIGAGTTDMVAVLEDKILLAKTFPIGGMHITNDIAVALKIPPQAAEILKIHFGWAKSKEVPRKEMIDLSEIDPNLSGTVSKRFLSEIIEARLEEIFDLVLNSLKEAKIEPRFPAGVVLVGGVAKLPAIVDLAKDALKMSAQIGSSINFSPETLWEEKEKEILSDPSFANLIGLALWALEGQSKFKVSEKKVGIFSKIKNFLKSFYP